MTCNPFQFPSRFLATVVLSGAFLIPPLPARGTGAPLLDLDAAGLAPGEVGAWTNRGSAGGVFEAGPGGGPKAATVDGRAAVEFAEGRWLRSAFPAPAGLADGHDFTVAMQVRATRIHGKGTVVSWASRPNNGVEIGYGRGSDGAILAGKFRAPYRTVPALDWWHEVVFTYAGNALSVYVDGELDARHETAVAPKAGEPVLLGAAWDAAKNTGAMGFAGAVSRVRAWDRALSHREVRNLGGSMEPFDPVPAPGARLEARDTVLQWQAGHPEARAFRVQVSTNAEAFGDAGAADAVTTNSLAVRSLGTGRTYYWRVAQADGSGTTLNTGPAWSFHVSDGPATDPLPRHRVSAVPVSISELTWRPGPYAVTQDLFFGDESNAVASGAAALARGLPATTARYAIPAGALGPARIFYWRVEQRNGDLPAARGEVWSFRTDEPPVPGELTFFVVSDTHYGMDPRGDAILPRLVDMMNALPGTAYPAEAGGGIVRQPRGVIHIGDCTNDGKPGQWAAFARDFGVLGEGRLAFPVYETFGNHDGGPTSPVRQSVKERTLKRRGLAHVSDNGMHYSWDWDGVHFVMLGISVGDTFNPYDPQHSYDFLVKDLRERVKPGQPLILMHHFGFDKGHSMNWWKDEARAKYRKVIKDHNVLGIFHGHAHRPEIYRWEEFDIFHPPHMEAPEQPTDKPCMHGIFIVRITKDEMLVVQRNLDGTWGLLKRKPLVPVHGAPASRS